MQLCSLCFVLVSLHIVCQLVCGQTLFDLRFTQTGIQIYAQDGATIDWFYIRNGGIEFPEGSVLCKNLTNNPLVLYYKNDETNMIMAELDCTLGDDSVSQCTIGFKNAKDQVNVTCLSREGWNEGDVRQLPDGRILYLVQPTDSPLLVWAHFCYRNNNWDTYTANLLCNELGYQNVKSECEQLKFDGKLKVFGLDNFDCVSPAPYNNCTFVQKGDNGKCSGDEVIRIECENLIPTSTSDHITTTTTTPNTVASNTTLPSTTPGLNIITSSISATTPNSNFTTMSDITLPSSTPGLNIITSSMFATTSNNVGTTMNSSTNPVNSVINTLNDDIANTLLISTTRVTTTSSNSSLINKSNINENAIIWASVTLGILLALMIGVIIIVVIIGIMVRRKRSKRQSSSNISLNNMNLPGIQNPLTQINDSTYTEIDFRRELLTREPSEYLKPVENPKIASFTFRNNNIKEQDEIIYEGVLAGHNQFVKPIEEREYYTLMQSTDTITTYVPEMNKSSYSTQLMCEDEYWEPGATIEGIYAQMSQYRYKEIERSELVEGNKLGEGNFGLVMSGYWKTTNEQSIPVAIKTLKIEDETSNIQFLQEAAILGQFHHANVLKLLGVVTISKPLYMVTEQMKTGLKNFLETIKQSGTPDFDLFSILFLRLTNDIANGMQHLASKKFVHRDLAARNILLSHTLTCKISDFGLARHAIEDDEYYTSSGGKIPLKWTAPEAIFYKKYSEKSDVWSYGVTIYEVWTVGAVPWEGLSPDDLIERLSQGVILPPPSGCPRRVYKLMVDCWNPDNHARPSFNQIMESLQLEEGMFLDRGKNPLERMELSLPPSRTERVFKDLQNRYITL